MEKVSNYLKLMRVKHYIKNLLIFLPLIFSLNFYHFDLVGKVVIGFIMFCLTSSVVYIINDIHDVEKDKSHPQKAKRPIASGEVSVKEGYFLACVLIMLITIIGLIANINLNSVLILVGYFLLNVAYSKKLKNIPLVDVSILVLCFVLRIIYGAFLIEVVVSNWLYLTIISFAFYLSLGKRRNEMQKNENDSETREVLKYYSKDFLDKNMYMCLALTIVFYAMWCVDPMNIEKFGTNYLIFTVPLLLIICMKYSANIEGDSYGDPVEVLLSDKILIALILIYVIVMGFIIL